MSWTKPKTDWVEGDYFNLEPDYTRIKGNIEYLIKLSNELYSEYDVPQLESANTMGYPTVSFFNNVVDATNAILTNCYPLTGAKPMRRYTTNGVVWNASELNDIEYNHEILYQTLTIQKASLRRLQLTLGGVKIGS